MKRVNYSKEDVSKALDDYKTGSTSAAVAAKYGVPGSTVRNHKSNPALRMGGGRPTLLSNQQEQYLVELFKNLEFIGVRLTKASVMKLASEYVQLVTGKSVEIGRKWLRKFLNRWQGELKVIKEEKMESSRRNGFTEDVRRGWFEKLDLILRTNDLIARPHAIFNCDESGFNDETAGEMVLVAHETKHAYEQTGGSGKNFTTNLVCGNAAGEILPPYIIYSAKNLNPQWTIGGPRNSQYAVSESGWITKYLFSEWFKWFINYTANVSKPILLIMDNHSCHISIEVIEMAKENQILLLLLPPSCTHALQPLDTVTFSAAKKSWKRIVTKYFLRNGRKTIRKIDLPSLFNQLYTSAFTPKQVVAGFIRAGVWPFDSGAMKDKVARQPLATQQLNQPPATTTSSENCAASSTQAFLATSDTTPVTTSFIPSSSSIYIHDQQASSFVLDLDNNDNDELNRLLNEIISMNTTTTTPKDTLSFTTNFSSSSLSGQIINTLRPLTASDNSSTSHSSFLNASDSIQFSSFISDVNLNTNSSNHIDLSFDKSNNTTSFINTNSVFKQNHQLTECISKVPVIEANTDEEDDGQKIIGYDPRNISTTQRQYSRQLNEQQHMSMINFKKDDDEENRTYTDLIPVDLSSFPSPPSKVFQSDLFNLNKQMNCPVLSSELSPSTAVRSIVTNLFRQNVIPPPLSTKTNKLMRTEGKYGEEITSSSKLNELKEKASKPNAKKRRLNSTIEISTTSASSNGIDTTTTAKRMRRSTKRTSELITSSQATRAITTLQLLSSNTGSVQNGNTLPHQT